MLPQCFTVFKQALLVEKSATIRLIDEFGLQTHVPTRTSSKEEYDHPKSRYQMIKGKLAKRSHHFIETLKVMPDPNPEKVRELWETRFAENKAMLGSVANIGGEIRFLPNRIVCYGDSNVAGYCNNGFQN